MNDQRKSIMNCSTLVASALLLLSLVFSGSSFAQNANAQDAKKNAPPPVTKETRDKMAAMHEKMATCLKSDKDISACHDEMRGSCQSIDGGRCGVGMMGPGMRGGMMGPGGRGPGKGRGNAPAKDSKGP